MRGVIASAVAAALLLASTIPSSAAVDIGVIRSIDTTAGTLTLDNGHVYQLPEGWSDPEIAAADTVRVEFNFRDKKRLVTEISE